MNETPLVSICCMTYNHAPFIRKCLEGFLLQETDFPIEILVHDDASTDGTDGIIREYAEKYPEIIFPLYEQENQFSKGKSSTMDIEYNYSRARGKYIAYCEGDDYWTDPQKLNKQVDFLEAHPDYSICWHRCQCLYWEDKRWSDDRCGEILHDNDSGIDVDVATLFSSWYTQPLSMVFRKSLYDFNWCRRYKYYRDEHEMYHLLTVGKGHLLNFIGGVYVIHSGGFSGSISVKKQCSISCNVAEELYYKNKNEDTKQFYIDSLQWAIYQFKNVLPRKISYSWKLFLVNGSIKSLIKNLLR